MDELPEDDETNRRRRRALVVFFAFVLMTAVGIGSLVLLLRGSEDVELARRSGVEAPSDGRTVTPTAAVAITTTTSTTVTSPATTAATGTPGAAVVFGADGDVGFGPAGGPFVGIVPAAAGGGGAGAGGTSGGTGGTGGGGSGGTGGGGSGGATATTTSTSSSTSISTSGGQPTAGLPFTMAATVSRALYPGLVVPLDVRFTNPNDDAIRLTSLTVEIAGGGPTDCPMDRNFTTGQFRGDVAGIVVPPNGTTTLKELGIDPDRWPTVVMVDTGTDQNACQGVPVTVDLSGTATGGEA